MLHNLPHFYSNFLRFFFYSGISYMIFRLIRLNMYALWWMVLSDHMSTKSVLFIRNTKNHDALKAVVVFVVIVVGTTQIKRFVVPNGVDLCAHYAWKNQVFILTISNIRACVCRSVRNKVEWAVFIIPKRPSDTTFMRLVVSTADIEVSNYRFMRLDFIDVPK